MRGKNKRFRLIGSRKFKNDSGLLALHNRSYLEGFTKIEAFLKITILKCKYGICILEWMIHIMYLKQQGFSIKDTLIHQNTVGANAIYSPLANDALQSSLSINAIDRLDACMELGDLQQVNHCLLDELIKRKKDHM